jgi:hypothetical protein
MEVRVEFSGIVRILILDQERERMFSLDVINPDLAWNFIGWDDPTRSNSLGISLEHGSASYPTAINVITRFIESHTYLRWFPHGRALSDLDIAIRITHRSID